MTAVAGIKRSKEKSKCLARYGFLLSIALLPLLTMLQGRRARAFVVQPTPTVTSNARIRRHLCGSYDTGGSHSGRESLEWRVALSPWFAFGGSWGLCSGRGGCHKSNGPNGNHRANAALRACPLLMAARNDENRSVEEEWPFHKSRYAARVCTHKQYKQCSASRRPTAVFTRHQRNVVLYNCWRLIFVDLPQYGLSTRGVALVHV